MSPLRALWQMLDARQRRHWVLVQSLALIMALCTLGGLASLAPFLLVLSDPKLADSYAPLAALRAVLVPGDDREFAIVLGAGFVCVVTLANAVNLVGSLAMSRFALRTGDQMHAALMDEYLHRDYRFHLRAGAADLFSKVIFSVNRVAAGMLDSALVLVTSCVTVLVIFVSILVVSPVAALAAVAWLGGGYLLLYAFTRRRLFKLGAQEALHITERTRLANQSLAAIKEVQVAGCQAYFRDEFAKSCRAISTTSLHTQGIAQSPRYALESFTVVGLVAAALLLSRGRALGAWIAQLTFLGFAAYRLLPAVQQAFVAAVRIRANRALFAEVAADLASAMRRRAAGRDNEENREAPLPLHQSLTLEEVGFAYRTDAPPVLREVSLRIPAGAVIGVAGANGSGKSTLIDLITGVLVPDTGRVCVDGVAIGDHNRARWQRALAYVPQQVHLFNATLAENIAFGVPLSRIDRSRLHEVASRARLDKLVERLPGGFDEPLGEGARTLSGGERQRVAIARALYRDSSVLVLDEPTAALDAAAAQSFRELLRELRTQHTVLIATHAPEILGECDTVFELHAGILVRLGSGVAMLAGRVVR